MTPAGELLRDQTRGQTRNAGDQDLHLVGSTAKSNIVADVPLWKRLVDVSVSLVLMIAGALPSLLITIAILLESGWPPMVRQRRIGVDGHEFLMWKFRSLPRGTTQVAKEGLSSFDIQVTRLGRFLRRTSIDEIPQVLNVFVGDMSLVGPRPALFNQYELTERRMKRGVLRLPPGITGLAQVSGREDLSLDEKVDLDERYVRTVNPAVDLRIAFRTIGAVLGGRGSR